MIYRFKVWFEEDEDISRIIDIHPISTFLELHNIVLHSIAFNKALALAANSSLEGPQDTNATDNAATATIDNTFFIFLSFVKIY